LEIISKCSLSLSLSLPTGKGQVIDVAMTEGANYCALPLYKWLQQGVLPRKEGGNKHLDATNSFLHQGPPWSTTYTCKDGEWMSVSRSLFF
jgi:crotonobetainyl-CoA:carnitine CoA-transferase CaiB-like acyl-CoA transferase